MLKILQNFCELFGNTFFTQNAGFRFLLDRMPPKPLIMSLTWDIPEILDDSSHCWRALSEESEEYTPYRSYKFESCVVYDADEVALTFPNLFAKIYQATSPGAIIGIQCRDYDRLAVLPSYRLFKVVNRTRIGSRDYVLLMKDFGEYTMVPYLEANPYG